ncbi:hypothetical protein ACEWY4_025939 [Coilia grayii]|uniref:LTD domain-containing protein n=1 Tax=Coilia grayii TaxID=363190 RepID=A0ABD1ITD9_9TELE
MAWLTCVMARMTVLCACLVCVCLVCVRAESCLMISEVNSDNPKFDTHEFVELFHSSGARTSLHGYTLVLYNGNGNQAYRIIDLSGHTTDDRGFFLIGSMELNPRPSVLLPPNSIQNGPDAVALYGPDAGTFEVGEHVRAHGLVDALVYATRRGGDVEELASILTPRWPPFLEDPSLFEEDESIQRCLETEHHWAFHVAPPTPGRANECVPPSPTLARIEELRLGGLVTSRHVELSIATEMGAMALLAFDGQTGQVRRTADIAGSGQSSRLLSVLIDTSGTGSSSGAVALYEGKVEDVLARSLMQPVDAFVFTEDPESLNATLLESLTPGRQPYTLTYGWEDGLSLSRCGVADWSRDSGTFMEAVSTPSVANLCPWPKICPHDIVFPDGTPAPTVQPWLGADFLLNELNSDSPGAAENTEFIEIWHPSGTRTSLEDVWLLLINGQTGRPYREISLSGYFTDADGYFLIGSNGLQPQPNVVLPPNIVQNGPDAVALYRSKEPPSAQEGVPTLGLLDAVVYRAPGNDKSAQVLTEALTPFQLPLLEDPQALPGDESISRCQGRPQTLDAFRVGPPTPMAKNVCPRPPSPEGLAINEVGGALGPNYTQESMFVELIGPPRTSLVGLVVMVFEGGTREAIPLKGSIGDDGLFLLNHTSGTDAVVLCYGVGVCDADSEILDSVIFTDVPLHLKNLPATTGHINPAIRAVADGRISLTRCSCCEHNSPSSWITSSPTPGLPNHCPSPTYSSTIHLCLEPQPLDGQDQAGSNHTNTSVEPVSTDCSGEVAVYLEQQCNCGITTLYLQGVNVSCVSGLMYLQGSIPALSEHQRALITHTTSSTHSCMRTGSLALPVGIVLGVIFLMLMGVALFLFLYRRKRPMDYSSMELSEHVEL